MKQHLPRQFLINRAMILSVSVIAIFAVCGCGAMLSAAAPYHADPRGVAALSALGQGITALEAAERSQPQVNIHNSVPGAQSPQLSTIRIVHASGIRLGEGHYTGAAKVNEAEGSWIGHGYGKHVSDSGTITEGVWIDGQLSDGTMRQTDVDGNDTVTSVRLGKRCGARGTSVYPDGVRQQGCWDYETMTGNGTIAWPDGRVYDGQWIVVFGQLDMLHGEGTMTWPDGRRYIGEWQDGKMSGLGTQTHPDGTVQKGRFIAGEFFGSP